MTLRLKLTMGAIAVVLVANGILSLANVGYLRKVWRNEVQNRVRLDLNAARGVYDHHGDSVARYLSGAALDSGLSDALRESRPQGIAAQATRIYKAGAMDYLVVLDAQGKVLYRVRNPQVSGDSLDGNPLISKALAERRVVAGSIHLPAAALALEGKELAEKARLVLQPTPAAKTTADRQRMDGMALAAAAPILDPQGKVLGLVYGGDVLNGRHDLVDTIRREVFPDETFDDKPLGTVTIFSGDLRIATNVLGEDGRRAVGTRLSEAVYDEVLERGETWSAPAFVVHDWYITAYEPIRDPQERIIGALYVGLLQAPFDEAGRAIAGRFLVMIGVATVLSLVLIFFITMLVMRPVRKIVEMSRRVIAGDLTARVGVRPPGEIGVLCQAIDGMADAVAQREAQLKQATRQQVTKAEKLASIGRLAAGVAHEINNPLTGVLTFAHLLHDKANMDDQDRQDLDLIIHETTRAADIVRGLLDFARERPTLMEPLDMNDVVRRTVRLIANQKKFEYITIEEVLAKDLPEICGDMNQLQQVLLNLALNACVAMPSGGKLTITTSADKGKVSMQVTDTGCGIKEEDLDMIFEPFFTTQPVGKGTGLGLSVTYGIVDQHGGSLEVQSKLGQGSVFSVVLPAMRSEAAGGG